MSSLSANELNAGISRRALATLKTNGRDQGETLEQHLAAGATGSIMPEKTHVLDLWNRTLDIVNLNGWNFEIRDTSYLGEKIESVAILVGRNELDQLARKILVILADSKGGA